MFFATTEGELMQPIFDDELRSEEKVWKKC